MPDAPTLDISDARAAIMGAQVVDQQPAGQPQPLAAPIASLAGQAAPQSAQSFTSQPSDLDQARAAILGARVSQQPAQAQQTPEQIQAEQRRNNIVQYFADRAERQQANDAIMQPLETEFARQFPGVPLTPEMKSFGDMANMQFRRATLEAGSPDARSMVEKMPDPTTDEQPMLDYARERIAANASLPDRQAYLTGMQKTLARQWNIDPSKIGMGDIETASASNAAAARQADSWIYHVPVLSEIAGGLARVEGQGGEILDNAIGATDAVDTLSAARSLIAQNASHGPLSAALLGATEAMAQMTVAVSSGGTAAGGLGVAAMNDAYSRGRQAGLSPMANVTFAAVHGFATKYFMQLGEGAGTSGIASRVEDIIGGQVFKDGLLDTLKKVPEQFAGTTLHTVAQMVPLTFQQSITNAAFGVDKDAMRPDRLAESLGDSIVQSVLMAGLSETVPAMKEAAQEGLKRFQEFRAANPTGKLPASVLAPLREAAAPPDLSDMRATIANAPTRPLDITDPQDVRGWAERNPDRARAYADEVAKGPNSRAAMRRAGFDSPSTVTSADERAAFLGHVQGALAEQSRSAPPDSSGKPVAGFTTAQGSTYERHDDGTTTRTKSEHVGHLPDDVGVKDRSDKTLYVDPEHAREIGLWNTSSAEGLRIIHNGDQITLVSKNPATGELGRDGQFPVSTEPAVGKSPLELWRQGKDGRWSGNHPGSPIIELRYGEQGEGAAAGMPEERPDPKQILRDRLEGRNGLEHRLASAGLQPTDENLAQLNASIDAGHIQSPEELKTVLNRAKRISNQSIAPEAQAHFEGLQDSLRRQEQRSQRRDQPTIDDQVQEVADAHGVHPDDLKGAAQDLVQGQQQAIEEREAAKAQARKMTGLDAGDISRLENSGKDHTSIPGFDTSAREIAGTYPELGLGGSYEEGAHAGASDAAAKLWDILREGKQDAPKWHDPEILRQAAELVKEPEHDGVFPSLVQGQPEDMAAIDKRVRSRGLKPSDDAPTNIIRSWPGRVLDSVRKTFNPQARSPEAQVAGQSIRQRNSELAQQTEQAEWAMRGVKKAFAARSDAENLDFIHRMETGQKQDSPELQKAADLFRNMLDKKAKEVQDLGTGKLRELNETYFPHIWSDPAKARDVIQSIYARRPLEGTKGFLKQRSIMLTKEGVAKGLEPASYNPADLVGLKLREMNKYLMGQRIFQDFNNKGLMDYVPALSKKPTDRVKLDGPMFTKRGPPEVAIHEAYDKQQMEGLTNWLTKQGVDVKRSVTMPGGNVWGYTKGKDEVATRFGGAVSILAHETGHVLDNRYGLWDRLKRVAPDEMRALADARLEGQNASDYMKSYVRKSSEKMAVLLEAYMHAPELFKEKAPTVYKAFDSFLQSKPELQELRDIKPSLTLQANSAKLKLGGFTELGSYYAPEPVARVMNNFLSPGLRGNPLYDLWRGTGNVLNQASLGLSGFHASATVLQAVLSDASLATEKLAAGQVGGAGITYGKSPAAVARMFNLGSELTRGYREGAENISDPRLRQDIENTVMAGGRVGLDRSYINDSAGKLAEGIKQFREGGLGEKALGLAKASLHGPLAALELTSKPTMGYLVPRVKLGAFAELARHELSKLPEDATVEQRQRVLQDAWDSIDNRFGQLVYDNLFWNRTAKDLSMAAVRSVGWNLGTARELGGAPIDLAKTLLGKNQPGQAFSHKMAYALALPTTVGLLGALTQYALTGQKPEELKDYFYPKTGGKRPDGSDDRVSLPSYMKDVYSVATHPISTVEHKANPLLSSVIEALNNQDFYGNQIYDPHHPAAGLAKYAAGQFVPFSVRNFQQQQASGGGHGRKRTPLPLAISPARGSFGV